MPFFNSFQENTFQFYSWLLCKYCDKLALHFGTEKLAHFFATFQNVNAFSSLLPPSGGIAAKPSSSFPYVMSCSSV